ncbi:hypothetical protein D3C72_1808550 [compost metagenome]
MPAPGKHTSSWLNAASWVTGTRSSIGRMASLRYRCGLMVSMVPGPTSTVWPSVARATSCMPMLPPAPGLLSTTTGWPSAFCRAGCISRDTMSPGAPAGKATTSRTGLVGQVSAAWLGARVASTAAAVRQAARGRRKAFMGCLLFFEMGCTDRPAWPTRRR